MIQPSFSFLVGVALPFSIAARTARGQSTLFMSAHAFWRAAVLILLGVFLRSVNTSQTYWTFEDTLSQIGLGYVFLFFLGFRSWKFQLSALVLILVGYWAAFAFYQLPEPSFDWAKAGVAQDWSHNMSGFEAHWNKNTNPAWYADVWFLNLFPRDNPFTNNPGGYSTLSFVPTLGTMILGLFAGGVLRGQKNPLVKVFSLLVIGGICLGVGYPMNEYGICPAVKRIWTPSWTLYSGGWCFIIMAASYLIFDAACLKYLAFPFMVIGANSITAYVMADVSLHPFIAKNLQTHFGTDIFNYFGQAYQPLVIGASVLLVEWLVLLWMYAKKIYIRV